MAGILLTSPVSPLGGGGGTTLHLYDESIGTVTPPTATGLNSIALNSGATAFADGSLALGDQSLSRHFGAFVQSSGRFSSTGDAQAGRYILRTHTTNNLPTEMFLDGTSGSQRLVLPDDSTWSFRVMVTGHRTDADDGHAGYEARGVIYRKAGGATVSLQGAVSKTVLAESNTPWDINIIADTTTGALRINVTGQTGKTIRWAALVETIEVTN